MSASNPDQVNIAVPGSLVGDPVVADFTSFRIAGELPGTTYHVNTTAGHSLDGIVGELSDLARQR